MEDSVTLLAHDVLTKKEAEEIRDEIIRIESHNEDKEHPADLAFYFGFMAAIYFLSTQKGDETYGEALEVHYLAEKAAMRAMLLIMVVRNEAV